MMANVNRYIPPNLREPLRQGGGAFMSLLDNVIGLDNDYDSAGERFGRQVRQDPVGTAKAVGGNILDSFTGFVQDPVGTLKEGAQEFGQSYNRASQGAVAYLPEGVELRIDPSRVPETIDVDSALKQIAAALRTYVSKE